MQLELVGLVVLAAAALVALSAWIWLLIRAFKVRFLWGVGIFLLPPLALLFIPSHWRRAWAPSLLLMLAAVAAAAPYGVNYYQQSFVDLGPREKIVNGEVHITLTGWDRKDYSILSQRPNTVVLQMANGDVTDQTLDYLKGMDSLRELDLNDSAVSDAALEVLAALPGLQELRLARTRITDAGFQKHLAAKESLRKLDLTGTDVKSKTKRDWKRAQADRAYLD